MITIGLCGGVASGKSLVAEQLAELGAVVLDADAAGHAVLRLPEVKRELTARWGEGILTAEGEIDRAAVGRIVFGASPTAPAELEFLEGVSHPRIRRRLTAARTEAEARGVPAVVLDAPVMFKAGWDALCDLLVYVDAPLPTRRARARARGWAEGELERREAIQLPDPEKRQRSQVVIDNSGDMAATRDQVGRLWRDWVLGNSEPPDKP